MDVKGFKKLKPEYKDIEGDQLWDAMTEYMLRQQEGDEIIKSVMPIWKTHTLRWLYYRKIPNMVMGNPKTDKWVSDKRCSKCKKGVNARMGFRMRLEDGSHKYTSYCPHCGSEYNAEANTNISHKLYKIGKRISKIFWSILDRLHLVRSSIGGRYDMIGDEARYVRSWGMNMKTGEMSKELKKRKWWEYILIENPHHKF